VRGGLQYPACDFRGKLGDGDFHVAASRGKFLGDPVFSGGHFGGRFAASVLQHGGALVEEFLASGFLLCVNSCAGLLERFLILLQFFGSVSPGGFGGFARTGSSRFTLGHDLKQRLEENRPENSVKKQNDKGCGHSLKEQSAKLVADFLHLNCVACTSG
jgi:hypothetical protein